MVFLRLSLELFSVIQNDKADHTIVSIDGQENPSMDRFREAATELSSLLMRQERVIQKELAGVRENPVVVADACGSWQSAVKWGQIAGLNAEQQVAFEILAAIYALTFYDEAENDLASETEVQFLKKKARLMQLAR
jgi:hypothetical protein